MNIFLYSLFAFSSQALPYLPILVGYMNLQSTTQNACQIDGSHVINQMALGSNFFHPTLCGQRVSVVVGDTTMSGTVIDALESSDRVMVSPNMFEEVASLDTGIVQGTLLLCDIQQSESEPQTVKVTENGQGISTVDQTQKQMNVIDQPQYPIDISEEYRHVLYQSNPQNQNDASFYFSADGGPGKCGAVNGIHSFPESAGLTACEPSSGYQTLMERGNDNIVAIPLDLMEKSQFCGKRIVVTIDGKERNDLNLLAWDFCAACAEPGNGGLDFSSNMFAELFGEENCDKGRIKGRMSWKLLDENVLDWHP